MCERVGRLHVVAVVGLLKGRAVVLGRRGPRIAACVVGYGRRIVHGWFSRSEWPPEMRMVGGKHLQPARDHDIAPAPDRHLPRAEGREHVHP